MKRFFTGAALVLALAGCGSQNYDVPEINKFLTDLSQVYVSDFKGPNPDDVIKIDFAVKRLCIDKPDAFAVDGRDMSVSSDIVHAKSDEYFAYPIAEDKPTSEVDIADGKYVIMKTNEQRFAFSKVSEIIASKNDTIMLNADVYDCAAGWKGDINSDPKSWETVDPNNIPLKNKKMRVVLVKKNKSYRILSYVNASSVH